MSCTLYLLRHGIAEPRRKEGTDADRRLTPEGISKTSRAMSGLKRLGVVPDLVLSSPLQRAMETAAIAVEVLRSELKVEAYPLLAPGHAAAEVLAGMKTYRRAQQIVLIGHQPDLGELASYLLSRSPDLVPLAFKKAGVAAIEVASVPPTTEGRLLWFLTPQQLRLIGHSRS